MMGKLTGFVGSAFALAWPQPRRKVNPFIAALLELLGIVGVLGLGRMYAGDPNGWKVLAAWFSMLATFIAVSSIAILGSLVASLATFGIATFLVVAGVALMIPVFSVVPIIAATRLFLALLRL